MGKPYAVCLTSLDLLIRGLSLELGKDAEYAYCIRLERERCIVLTYSSLRKQ